MTEGESLTRDWKRESIRIKENARGAAKGGEAKKQARKQRLLDIEEGIEFAAAVAFTVLTDGAGSETITSVTAEVANDAKVVQAGEEIATSAETAAQVAKDTSWLRTIAVSRDLFEVGGNMARLQLTNGQLIAGAVSTVGQTWIGDELGGTNGAIAGLLNGIISTVTMGSNLPMTGFVSWTPHQNKDILLGEDAQAGGWGGGVAIATDSLPLNAGLSFAPGSGVDVNVNYNFKGAGGEGLGFAGVNYNAGSGNASVSGGVDLFGKDPGAKHHGGLTASVSKDGTSSIGGYYNYGDGRLPPNLRGHGFTLNYSTDGRLNLSGQFKGSTVASVNYNTQTGRFEKLEGNINFQNDLNLAFIQEHAIENSQKGTSVVAEMTGRLLVEMGELSKSELSVLLRDPEGTNKINELFESRKAKLDTQEKRDLFKLQLKTAGDRLGVKVEFEPSVTETWQKLTNRVLGDVLLAFGGANTGLSAVDTAENTFRTKTCFEGSQEIWTVKGYRRLNELKSGDKAYTLNEETGEIEIQEIEEVITHNVKVVNKLRYGNGGIVTTTWNHPFAILNAGERSKNSGVAGDVWAKAEDLKPGDRSITKQSIQRARMKSRLKKTPALTERLAYASIALQGNPFNGVVEANWKTEVEGTLEIEEIREVRENEKVYNLEMSGNHNYFIRIGNDLALVHNYDETTQAILKDPNLTPKEKMEKLLARESFTFEGKTWNREEITPEKKDKNGKIIQRRELGYVSEENQYGKKDTLSFRETKGGKVEAVQLQEGGNLGKYYKETKTFDEKFRQLTGRDKVYGNTPDFKENPQYYRDEVRIALKDKGIEVPLITDVNGKKSFKFVNPDGKGTITSSKSVTSMIETDGGILHIDGQSHSQLGANYQGETYNGKPKVHDGPGGIFSSNPVLDTHICNSNTLAMDLQARGFKMTPEQMQKYGRLEVMIARDLADYGATLNPPLRPSQLDYVQKMKVISEKYGYELNRREGGKANKFEFSHKNVAEEPDPNFYGGKDTEDYRSAVIGYKKSINESPQMKQLFEYIKHELRKGNRVIIGGKLGPYAHMVTVVGYDKHGFIVQDPLGDLNANYHSGDGRYNRYRYNDPRFLPDHGFVTSKKK
ncbi:TIGR04388 family protein [Leptospira fluminis]|uniref:TIGR04388 family protein n=1 Tax=Leptospira fluminis TaxID=2484979 RepID=UPI00143AE6D4|nr:TIGR04388 family protein [Leptospira fluminis]